MAGNTIANLNVKLLANISGFASGMASATKPLRSFAGDVASTSLKVAGFVGAITSLVAGGSISALVHHSMEAIDSTAKLADRLGATTEGLVGLEHAGNLAGVSNEQLVGGLEKLLKSMGGVSEEGDETKDTFAALGLSLTDLKNSSADSAFIQVAQKISEIQNPTERATVAMKIFGKSGQALLPLLMSGAEGIKAAQEEAALLGMTFSRLDAAKVEAANDSMTRLTGIVTGVGNQIAIGLAPYIDAAATKLVHLATEGGGIGPKVGGAVEWVATSVAYLSDYLNVLNAGWQVLRGAASYALGSILDVLGLVITGIEYLYEKVTGTSTHIGEGMQNVAKAMLSVGDEAFQKAGESWQAFQDRTNSKTVAKAFQNLRANADKAAQGVADNAERMKGSFKGIEDSAANLKKVTDALDDLDKQVKQFGMTSTDKKLDDLTGMGANPEQLSRAKAALEQLDKLNEAKKKADALQGKAKSVIESVQTPTEKYDEQITSLNDLLAAGAISYEIYGRAVRKAHEELEKPADVAKIDAPELFKAGSAQAAKFAYDLSRGSQSLSKDEIPKKQYAEAKTQTDYLDKIWKNTRPTDDEEVDI